MSALFSERNRARWWLVAGFVATCYIIGSSYLGINGRHAFRQADVYSQLLGFANTPGFHPLDLFVVGQQAVFDIPAYQALIGTLADWTRIDALVLCRYVNLLCLLLTATAGYRLCTQLLNATAGVIFVALLCTSRLTLHYHSVPLPDNLSLALSLWGIQMLWSGPGRHSSWLPGMALAFAALIKSPIPFVFLAFHTYLLTLRKSRGAPWREWLKTHRNLIVVLATSLIAALSAEFMRRQLVDSATMASASDPRWYFGDMSLRTSAAFWDRLIGRIHSASSQLFLPTLLIVAASCLRIRRHHPARHAALTVLHSAAVSYLLGWLVFANVYFMHDYYQLPVICIGMLAFAVAYGALYQVQAELAPAARGRLMALHGALLLVLLAAVLRLIYSPLSDRDRDSFETASAYALRQSSHFIFVSDLPRDPSVGGKRATKFIQMPRQQWARDCAGLLDAHPAFLLEHGSPCETQLKERARQILKSDTLTLFVVR